MGGSWPCANGGGGHDLRAPRVVGIVTLDDLREQLHLRAAPSFRLAETIECPGDDLAVPLVVREGSDFALSNFDNEVQGPSVHRTMAGRKKFDRLAICRPKSLIDIYIFSSVGWPSR